MRRSAASAFVAMLVVVGFAAAASAAPITPPPLGSFKEGSNEAPGALEGVGIKQRLGEQLPLDTVFRDEDGREVRIGDYFGDKPVVLAMAYYECPMLCTLVLNGLVKALRPLGFTAGDEFEVVTISIDPEEGPELARGKKEAYLESYERRGGGDGFHFLTGEEASIRAVADSIGFSYTYLPETGEYAHGAAIYVLTPAGKISHYFFGVEFSSRDLRLALVEAADEHIGNVVDQLMLYCFRYDPTAGKYSAAALAIVRLGGVVTVLSLAGFIGLSRWRETRPPSPRS
jgi:protein SCO1/2